MNDKEYSQKVTNCLTALDEWLQSNSYSDVFVAACAAVIAALPDTQGDSNPLNTVMFYVAYSHHGAALISVDYDVVPFLEACDKKGVGEVRYNTPMLFNKNVDNVTGEGGNPPNKTIH